MTRRIFRPSLLAFVLLVALSVLAFKIIQPAQAQSNTTAPVEISDPPPIVPTAVTTETVDLEALLPPYVPEEQIPICPESDPVRLTPELVGDGPKPEDYAKPPRCRSRILDLPIDRNTNYRPTVFTDDSVKSAAQGEYSYLVNTLNCTTCNGSTVPYLKSFYMIASAQRATLAAGNYGWGSYHVAARVHAISDVNVNNCNYDNIQLYSSKANVSLGHTMGYSSKGTFTGNMQMFWEDLAGPFNCGFNIIDHTVSPSTSIYYNIYTTGTGTIHYIGRFWWNGAWEQAFDKSIAFGDFVQVDAGLEARAGHEDFTKIGWPLNFVQKQRIGNGGTLYTLNNAVLPAALQGWVTVAHGEWDWLDPLLTGDFSSVTGSMNQ